ncbi:MAG: KH domain-containing protein [Candidatus Enteromonas sp.]|nr:KH domain-containing protein [Candidatus Enteromonas sp.]
MKRDYTAILMPVISPLVHHPENIRIQELSGETDRGVSLLITADNDDAARLIGKSGTVANALREVIGIVGKADDSNQRIRLKFESFEGNETENDGE